MWKLLIYLPIGTVAMLVPMMLQGKQYGVKPGKLILTAVLLTVAGTLGTMLLYFLENGRFNGTSFFGAIFFVPLLFIPVAKLLKMPYWELMDLCAPAECVMLAVMKVQCCLTGCCGGREIIIGENSFVFPSQIAELVNALLICGVLLLLSRKDKNRRKLFPWYMFIYGVSRFGLNLLRNTRNPVFLPIPFGNLWSIVAVAVGLLLLLLPRKMQAKENV